MKQIEKLETGNIFNVVWKLNELIDVVNGMQGEERYIKVPKDWCEEMKLDFNVKPIVDDEYDPFVKKLEELKEEIDNENGLRAGLLIDSIISKFKGRVKIIK